MSSSIFCRYDLRTTDPDAARRFYGDVLGWELALGESQVAAPPVAVWLLHEQARARGAPAHWLGAIGVADVEATVQGLIELGSERLGPTVQARDGSTYATLRDPGGAVVAVRSGGEEPRAAAVAWHQLHTRDVEQSWAVYSGLFGWKHARTFDVPELEGEHRMFAWGDSGKSVGAMANTARAPGVHAHWLYFFPVADLDAALARVRARGGSVGHLATLPNGDRLAGCEDPQGAAFGLSQVASLNAV